MKDKLVRYHHGAFYYAIKKLCIGTSIVVATSVLIAIPLSFGLNLVKSNQISDVSNINNSSTKDLIY